MIDWTSDSTHWMLSPYMTAVEKKLTADVKDRLKWITGCIWIASSGTTRTDGIRWVGLSKRAFLIAAQTVSEFLEIRKRDILFNVLPTYHVGGLSLLARAHITGAKLVDLSDHTWNAKEFVKAVERHSASFTSMVPTQVFDLVQAGLHAPKSMRAISVGGAALGEDLYHQARALGWPLLPCYGMTEVCAQIASASLQSLKAKRFPPMHILPHAKVQTADDRLLIKTEALCDYLLHLESDGGYSLEWVRRGGWFRTEDLGIVENGCVRVTGRLQERVKILGELVSVPRVEEELRRYVDEPSCVLVVPDRRRGSALLAVVESPESLRVCAQSLRKFQTSVNPLWRLDNWYAVDRLPRSPLGKILKAKLAERLKLTTYETM